MSGHKSKTVDELAAIGRPAVNAGVLQTDLDIDDTLPTVTANDVKTNAVEKLSDKDFTISMVRQQHCVSHFQFKLNLYFRLISMLLALEVDS